MNRKTQLRGNNISKPPKVKAPHIHIILMKVTSSEDLSSTDRTLPSIQMDRLNKKQGGGSGSTSGRPLNDWRAFEQTSVKRTLWSIYSEPKIHSARVSLTPPKWPGPEEEAFASYKTHPWATVGELRLPSWTPILISYQEDSPIRSRIAKLGSFSPLPGSHTSSANWTCLKIHLIQWGGIGPNSERTIAETALASRFMGLCQNGRGRQFCSQMGQPWTLWPFSGQCHQDPWARSPGNYITTLRRDEEIIRSMEHINWACDPRLPSPQWLKGSIGITWQQRAQSSSLNGQPTQIRYREGGRCTLIAPERHPRFHPAVPLNSNHNYAKTRTSWEPAP